MIGNIVLPFLLRRRVIEPEQIWDYDPRPGGPNVIYHSTQLDELSLCVYVCMCVCVCVCVCMCYKFSHSPFSEMAALNRTSLLSNGCLHSRTEHCLFGFPIRCFVLKIFVNKVYKSTLYTLCSKMFKPNQTVLLSIDSYYDSHSTLSNSFTIRCFVLKINVNKVFNIFNLYAVLKDDWTK